MDYYELQSDGLGYDFLDEYEKTLSRIWRFPEAWTLVTSYLRRCLMRRFPYAVFYTIMEEEIVISAVAELRMDPDYIRE